MTRLNRLCDDVTYLPLFTVLPSCVAHQAKHGTKGVFCFDPGYSAKICAVDSLVVKSVTCFAHV